jgi:hypothetical protein
VPSVAPLYSSQVFAGWPEGDTTLDLSSNVGDWDDGDKVIAIMCGIGITPALPSGWTSLTSGAGTNLDYRIGWASHTGSLSYAFGNGLSASWTVGAGGEGTAQVALLRFIAAGSATPTGSVSTAASGTSVAFESTSGLLSSFQVAYCTQTAAAAYGSYTELNASPSGQDRFRRLVTLSGARDLGSVGSDNYDDTEKILTGTATATSDSEWVSIAVGFA